jgi:hypothetical protein
MITSILAAMTIAATMGTEPPALMQTYEKPAACKKEANKLNAAAPDNSKVFVCLNIKYPTV